MQTEKQIVESVKKGERKGQDELVSRFAAPVFAMIARQIPDMMDAQELLQDTFLKAFRYIGHFDGRRLSVFPLHLAMPDCLPTDERFSETPSTLHCINGREFGLADRYQRHGTGSRTLHRQRTTHRTVASTDGTVAPRRTDAAHPLLLRRPPAHRDSLYHRHRR